MNRLLEFRTTYLRAVAEAWADPDGFGVELKNNPRGALRRKFHYEWPWPNMDLKIVDAVDTVWGPKDNQDNQDNQWTWPTKMQESLTIRLPLKSPATHPDLNPVALAAYYENKPIIFGDPKDKKDPVGSPTDKDPGEPGSRPLMPNHEGFEEFQVAVLAAMAKAWGDPIFKELLLSDGLAALNKSTLAPTSAPDPTTSSETPQIHQSWKLPWKLNIVVEDDTESRWAPGPRHKAWIFNKNKPTIVLTLCLPPKPTDSTSSALALAMYNAAGAEYPFTCCG